MAIERWSPFADFRRFDDMFNRLWRSNGGLPETQEAWSIPLDVTRSGDDVVVKASLPGVEREKVDVTIEENVLTIRAEVSADGEREDAGTFSGSGGRGPFSGRCACRRRSIRRMRVPLTRTAYSLCGFPGSRRRRRGRLQSQRRSWLASAAKIRQGAGGRGFFPAGPFLSQAEAVLWPWRSLRSRAACDSGASEARKWFCSERPRA